MALGLPLSKFLMSLSQFCMVAAWLANGDFSKKWNLFKLNFLKILPFVGVFLLHFIGLIWSNNISYGLHDVRVKLPLLIIPIMMATMQGLQSNQFFLLLKIYLVALVIGVFVSLWFYFGFSTKPIQDIRDISRFVSHIRFSLMLCLGVFISVFFYWINSGKMSLFYLLLAVFFSVFLLILHSGTGLVIVLVLGIFSVFYMMTQKNILRHPWLLSFLVLFIVLFSVKEISWVWKTGFPPPEPVSKQLIKNGRHLYFNDTLYKARENGNYIWINMEIVGLKNAWNFRTGERFEDSTGVNRIFILARYLSSLGLPKDSESVMQLTDSQVKEIQGGCTNFRFCNTLDPKYRIYQTLWEIEDYQHQGNADGHSIVMRWEFWKAGIHILRTHWIFGVGTGDVADAFAKSYDEIKSELNLEYRLRAHNQYLTFAVAFGLIGIIPILYFVFLIIKYRPTDSERNYLAWIFILISFLSMINEDTLETQAGVSFIVYFASLFWLTVPFHPEIIPVEEKAK